MGSSRFAIIIFVIITSLGVSNFWNGKQFHYHPDLPHEEIRIVDGVRLYPEKIRELMHKTRTHGKQLIPNRNMGNAQGVKLDSNGLDSETVASILTPGLSERIGRALGHPVTFADTNEKYRIFFRLYADENDNLAWHYDNNFSRGRRYTLVVPLHVDACNTSEFAVKRQKTGAVETIRVPPGKAVLYNGSEVYHKITPQTSGCVRFVMIIPFYENPNVSPWGAARRFMRNLTYRAMTL